MLGLPKRTIFFGSRHDQCDVLCAPDAVGFGVDLGPEEMRWSNADRNSTCIIQYTTRGHGLLEHDETGEHWSLPEGSLFLLNVPAPLTYLKPADADWEVLWVTYSGAAARRLSDSFISRHGYVAAVGKNGAVVQALIELFRYALDEQMSPFGSSVRMYGCLMALGDHLASGGRPGWLVRACRAIEAGGLTGSLDLEAVAKDSGLSRFHFSRRFKQQMGMSPHRYFTACRMSRARELIQITDRRVVDIGRELGFDDYAYFCRAFRVHFGTSPGSLDRFAKPRRGRRSSS